MKLFHHSYWCILWVNFQHCLKKWWAISKFSAWKMIFCTWKEFTWLNGYSKTQYVYYEFSLLLLRTDLHLCIIETEGSYWPSIGGTAIYNWTCDINDHLCSFWRIESTLQEKQFLTIKLIFKLFSFIVGYS